MTVNREDEAGALTDALNQPIDGICCERAAPFGRKDEAAVGELPAQLPKRLDFVASERVHRRLAVLKAADMQRGRTAELHLRRFKIAYLGSSQAVSEGDQDQCCVPR